MKFNRNDFPVYIAEVLGERLKRARLNKNLTQNEVAQLAWVSRRTVLNAEKGEVRLTDLIAILQALNLVEQLKFIFARNTIFTNPTFEVKRQNSSTCIG